MSVQGAISRTALIWVGLSCLFDSVQAQEAKDSPSANMNADIVVVAQRREERLQDVPIAVTSLGGSTLEKANIVSALDVGKVASGLVFQQSTGTVTTFIRGLGNNQLAVGNEASNSLYIDSVYYARISPVLMRLNNVERVEILKGPQGTLFGRNATGGLINILTTRPEPGKPLSGKFTLGYGNYDTVEADAYVSAGLTDTLAGSVAILNSYQGKGWGTNVLTGEDTNRQEDFAMRGKLLFEPSDRTTITIAGDYSRSNSTIGLLNYYDGKDNPAPAGYGDGSGYLPPLRSRYDKNSNLKDLANTRGWGAYARWEQGMSFADLVATVAFHDERIDYHNDIDKSPQTFFHFEEDNVYDDQVSAELQLVSNKSGWLKWTAGLFYLQQKFGFPTPARLSGAAFGSGVTVLPKDSGETNSYAAYGQASAKLTDQLQLTLGGRINRDELQGHGLTDVFIDGVGLIPGTPLSARKNFQKFTYRVALDYKPATDMLLYASLSRGTKAGLFNLITFNPVAIRPEVLDAYEVGFKSQFLDRRLRLNLGAFFYDYQNPQVQTQQPNGVTNLSNAKAAEIKGLEAEVEFFVTPRLSFRASGTWLDAKYTDYKDAPFYTANPLPPYGLLPAVVGDATGNRLSRAPRFSGNAGVSYSVDLPGGNMAASVNYAYTGGFYWTPDNFFRQKDYGLLDASLSYSPGDSGATLQIWGSNLTNARYNLTANEFGNAVGLSSAPGAPRTYGVRLKYAY